MKLSFDKFELYELPQVTLCNPNSRATEVDGKITITDTVGVLSNLKGMNLKLNFNAPHELSFDYYRHKSNDPIKQSFYDSIYEAIQTDRYVYLTDIGYFIISSVTDSDEDNIDKKSISCKSCEENEFATAEGIYLEEGTCQLHTEDNKGLLDLFLPKTAGWTIGFIDPALLVKYDSETGEEKAVERYVEKTEVDNGYNFLYTTVQDMFECIVEPDIIRRTVSVYSRAYYAEHHLTDIHIAKYNLLKHKTVEENDEDKYTALNVQGKDENLEIRAVNPTGKNVIYNFEPRYSWMSSALQVAVTKWQEKCESVEDEYLTLQQGYYTELEKLFNEEQDIEVLKGELEQLKETKDIAFTMVDGDEKDQSLINVNKAITAKQNEINSATSTYNTHKQTVNVAYEIPIAQINSDCALDVTAKDIDGNTIFTTDLLNELMTHIKPTDYVDEYMLVTESMTYPQKFEKAKELMNRAQSQLVKISSGQKTYSIDTRSFLFNKQFRHFSELLCAGAIIYVETKTDKMEQLHLTGIDINFDDKSTNFTLGNKYDRSDLKALYEDALGQNSKSFSELKYIASIIEDQQKQLDYQRNWVADLRTLTLDNVLTSEDQAIEINNRGLIGRKRKLDENGEWAFDENGNPLFDPEQVKLINQTLVFTDDNWKHAATAIGKIAVGYNADGTVKYDYGMNGRVIIGELILGNNLVLTGTGAGIKIKDNNGNNVFYADDKGNLNLIGNITATSGEIAGWDISDTSIYKTTKHNNHEYTISLMALPFYWEGNDSSSERAAPIFSLKHTNNGTSDWPFVLRKDGSFTCTKANITGTINAKSGEIGGWQIKSGYMQSTNKIGNVEYITGIQSNNNVAFVAGATDSSNWSSGKFYVKHTGEMHAEDVNITGEITATSGTIGNCWRIQEGYLQGYVNDNNYVTIWAPNTLINPSNNFINVKYNNEYTFRVTATGWLKATNADISGKINADQGGTIGGWTIDATNNKLTSSSDKFQVDIKVPTAYYDGTEATSSTSTVMAVKDKTKNTWPFIVRSDGTLVADKANITGTINATSGTFERDVRIGNRSISHWIDDGGYINEIKATKGSVGGWEISQDSTYGNYLMGTDSSKYFVRLTPRTLYATDAGYNKYAPWYNIAAVCETGSDKNIKNNISNIDETFETVFDNLSPITFNYIYDNNPQLHFGFIAQDILDIFNNIGINNFAGLWKDEYYNLNKQEFIALNTWQIQRCKKRIIDLENTVAELKTQIQTLTAG